MSGATPGTARPRLLVPLTYGLSVRYVLPTGLLEGLRLVCEPVVGMGWVDDELASELTALAVEHLQLPASKLTHDYRMYRRKVTLLRDRRLGGPTVAIRRRRQRAALHNRTEEAISWLRRMKDELLLTRPTGAAAIEAAEATEVQQGTNMDEFVALLEANRIDAVLSLTPYHDQDGLLLWAARRTGRPSFTSVISFDNPTTRERLPVRSERILVWNRHNAAELLRSYPDLTPDCVGIIGAPQFDLHHRADLVLPHAEWCTKVGVDPQRPVILYGAGPSEMVPHEHRLVQLLDEAIDDGRIPGHPTVLVRRHPVDPPEVWSGVASELRHGVVADPWTEGPDAFRSWPSREDVMLQMSSLAHTAVHVNVCSSMSLDGALFDRPQVCPDFVPGVSGGPARRLKDFYRQEHWQPIARSGGVTRVGGADELVAAVVAGLRHPGQQSAGRRRMVMDVLTFDDGASTGRLVDEVARSLERTAQPTSEV